MGLRGWQLTCVYAELLGEEELVCRRCGPEGLFKALTDQVTALPSEVDS